MATAEQYASWIVQNKNKKGTPEFDKVVAAYKVARGQTGQTTGPTLTMPTSAPTDTNQLLPRDARFPQPDTGIPESNIPIFQMARESPFLRGMIDPAAGGAQMLGELTGLTSLGEGMPDVSEHVRREEQAYQQARGEDAGFDWGRMGGSVVSPLSLASMGGSVPAQLLPRMARGARMGAGLAAAQPVQDEDFWRAKAEQATVGAATGGAIPLVGRGIGTGARKVTDLITAQRAPKMAERFLREQAGEEAGDIVTALERAQRGQTAGQAIARGAREAETVRGAPLVKLEAELAKESAEGARLRDIYSQQESGRRKIINAIAGTDEDMAKAVQARTGRTEPLYKVVEASRETVDVAPVVSQIDNIIAKNKNDPTITAPLENIKGRLDDVSPGALYSLSKYIKRMMGETTVTGQKAYDVGTLVDVKKVLDKQIGEAEEAFKQAQSAYRELSGPINQMEVGRYLRDKLVGAMDTETPGSFAGAVRDAPTTLKRSTGFPRFKELGDVLPEEQVTSVSKIADELMTQAKAKKMAGQVGGITRGIEQLAKPQEAPTLLSRPVVMANYLLGRMGKQATPEMKRVMADIMADPAELQRVLRLPETDPRRQMVADLLNQVTISGTAQATGRDYGQ
ncbi:MAG: hypothetical protein GWN00_19770 [Aliifodinibius sp.]|nr:hypothetical protein [Fodinibius sp.]NIY26961.1 hypothetical protein [Fodinibius sp.]